MIFKSSVIILISYSIAHSHSVSPFSPFFLSKWVTQFGPDVKDLHYKILIAIEQ